MNGLELVRRRLSSKHRAFVRTFLDANGDPQGDAALVLSHLQAFCRGDRTSIAVAVDGHIDAYATCVAEGRREVWLEIQKLLNLDEGRLHEWAARVAQQEGME
jgi:hypothetical protein